MKAARVPPVLEAASLRCRYLVDPLGVDSGRVTFDWVPVAKGEPSPQAAYQVLVATDAAALEQGSADCWDSGRVESSVVAGARYGGAPLASRARCWWTVRLWAAGEDEPGPYAPPATFEVGLAPADWSARWIGGEAGVSSPLLRSELLLDAPPRRARVYVSALGYYELWLNGEKVGDRVLDPAQSSYDHDPELVDGEGSPASISRPSTLYSTFDITPLLAEGPNAVGLMLGHGWFSAEDDIGPGPLPRKPWGDRPRVRVQIEVETAAGELVALGTDETWQTAAGPVVYNDYAHGERHDARRESPGWDRPGYPADGWHAATSFDPPAGVPRPQEIEPVRVVETLMPIATVEAPTGARIADFGQHFSGWTRVAVSGPAGSEVTLRHAGELGDGVIDDDANMGAWLPARQTDSYVLRGDGVEVWEPRFTLHGFRYVEITTSDDAVEVQRIEGRVVHSDLARIGSFACSDPLLERIHRNVGWTHRTSFQGFPQDAAERNERVGWVGDPGWAIEDYLFNFDAAAFWLKWLEDLRDAQLEDGRFPVICPIQWRGGIDMAPPEGYEVPEDLDTMVYWPYGAWPDFSSTSYPSIAWQLYRYTGDVSILEAHYEGMRRGLEYLRSIAEGLIVTVGLGDHMEPQPDGTCSVFAQRTPVDLTSTAWFFAIARIVADAAEILGRSDDARACAALAESIRAAFNSRFLDTGTGTYASGSQTAQALPLWLGLVPDEHRQLVLDRLVEQIRDRDGGHLSTGTMGTAALQQVLADGGAAETMYELATKTTFPGWGNQIARGATTVWETWGGDPTFSRNMKLMASVEKFLFKDVAGLAPAAPGWARILVRPRLTHVLTHARARVRTVRGDAAVEWQVADGRLEMRVEVPATSVAEVWLPSPDPDRAADRIELGGGVHRLQAGALASPV